VIAVAAELDGVCIDVAMERLQEEDASRVRPSPSEEEAEDW
jgi:hypothetical protein